MKAIMVMFDSLNRHMLPPYGCEWTHTPNFERLAQRTAVFDNCYVGSMPCMPARRDLHTGRYNFLHRSWGPLEPFDDSMPEILRQNGVYTHLVSDHQHYWEDGGCTYHNRYTTWENVRGQEGDLWKGHVADPEIPPSLSNKGDNPHWRQDWVNRTYMKTEADQPQTQVFDKGLEFIRQNQAEDNWFLQIEAFDPHEPFFTQQHYKDLYPHEYDGPHFDWPDYKRVAETREQIQHVRYEYAALLSMCDHSLGRVLDLMDELNLWDDTLLIVNTDHGYLLAEHEWWAKNSPPLYSELARTPLFVWDPRCRVQGERRDSLVQLIDFAPTLLEYFGIERPPDMRGIPLREAIASNALLREAVIFGYHGQHCNCTDGRYVYMRAPATPENQPLYEYTLMATHMGSRFGVEELQDVSLAPPFDFTKGCSTLKIPYQRHVEPFGTLLFDLVNDPKQEHPLDNPEIETTMIAHMVRLMQTHDAPIEQYTRLGLPVPTAEI